MAQSLRKEMTTKAKAAGKTDVPYLQESVVEVHVHSGTKRKVELPPRADKGKDVNKVRAALLGAGLGSGVGSASGVKGPEFGLIELPEISVRKDIAINLLDTIINSIDGMEANHIVRTMVEFGSKALILSRRVGSLYRREVKEGVGRKWKSCRERGTSLRRRGPRGRKKGRVGRRREKGWEHGRSAVWTQWEN